MPDEYSEYGEPRHHEERHQLTERNAGILRQFESWLRDSENEIPVTGDKNEPGIGLYQLFEALASQRHELKLYTKSGRQTQELLAKSIEETAAAVALLRRFRRDKPDIERKAVKPLLTSLIEIDESLERAVEAAGTIEKRVTESFRSHIERCAATYCDGLSFWGRFRKRKTIFAFARYLTEMQQAELERIFQPFQSGFEMLRQRMNDILKKHAVRRLDPQDELLAPETMRVVAVVESETVPPDHVVEVVRPGYLWRGTPLRFADVRVAR